MSGSTPIIATPADLPRAPDADLWVFGYGSLMWDPGFPHVEQRQAVLNGFHRSFCIASHRHRGTPQCPGLVFGLDRGGSCQGIAYRVAADKVSDVLDYLWFREMDTDVYHPRLLPVQVAGGAVESLCFVVNPDHEQYLGRLPVAKAAAIICRASGGRGANIDYLVNTADHLRRLGIRDDELETLRAAVERLGKAAADVRAPRR